MKFKLAVAILFLCFDFARAHDPGLSTLKLHHTEGQIRAELIFSPSDLEYVSPLDQDGDAKISTTEFADAHPLLRKAATNLLEIFIDGKRLQPLTANCSHDTNDNFQFEITFEPADGELLKADSKWFNLLPPNHRQFVSFQEGTGPSLTEDLLDAANPVFTVQLTRSSTGELPPKRARFGQFFVLGIEHILTGFDHLLFLFALLIVCKNFVDFAKIVTCFTLAHSITLALATLNIVTIPGKIIEPAIAASIVYVGLENIFRHGHPKGRWLLTFAFGLVHGFGFAGVLRDMQIAKAGSVIVPLVSFNLGVEAGQIAVAAILLPILWKLKKSPAFTSRWIPICSALVAAAGAFWFIQRVWF